MSQTAKYVDPRVKRTRQLLQKAFLELLREKSMEGISIQDITERATINRATFYAHFPDKYALMDSIVREQFQSAITERLPPNPGWNRHCLQALVRAIFGLLGEFHPECKLSEARFVMLSNQAVQQGLAELLLGWIKTASVARMRPDVRPELIASAISWAIFGPAGEWKRNEQTLSADEMTRQIMLVITEGLAHLAPNFLPE
jgi:AcrR family transcriptional regulator